MVHGLILPIPALCTSLYIQARCAMQCQYHHSHSQEQAQTCFFVWTDVYTIIIESLSAICKVNQWTDNIDRGHQGEKLDGGKCQLLTVYEKRSELSNMKWHIY